MYLHPNRGIYGSYRTEDHKNRPGGIQAGGIGHERGRHRHGGIRFHPRRPPPPASTQAELREQLNIDKGAAARRAAAWRPRATWCAGTNPQDGRSQLLYATEQAQGLRNSKAQIEAIFMNGCWQNCPGGGAGRLRQTLNTLYLRSKKESRSGFPHMEALMRKAAPDHG